MAMTSTTNEPPARTPEQSLPGSAAVVASAGANGQPDLPWYLDPREVLPTLRLRPWWVALPVLAGLVLALLALLLVPARYTSSTELLIDPQGLQIIKDDLNPPGQANDASLLLVDSQMQVLSSDDVLRRVVERFGLDRDPDFVGRASVLGQLLGALPSALRSSAPVHDARLDALRTLRERLSVRRMERTFALVLSVTTAEREKSAQLAQGVAETYLAYDQQVRAEIAQRASTAITARLGELQDAVRDAEDKAQAYRTSQNLVGTRTQLVSEQQLGQIGEQLGAARARAADQLTRLNQIEAVLKAGGSLDALPEVLQSPTITQLRTQLAQAERVLADQSTRLGSRHPAMIAAQSDVQAAQAQLNAEVKRIATSVRNEYKAAAANAAALSDTLDKGKSEAVSVGDAQVHLRELERQIEARRSVYESFLVRARELQAQQQLGTSATRIISPASPPARRDGPSTAALLGAVGVAGLGLGIGCALLAERASGRVRTARRLAQRLGLDVIGTLPPLRAGGEAADEDYDRAVARLRNHLWRTGPSGGRLILVTAADRLAGKAQLALKLAMVAASDQDRVLIVDADPDGNLPNDYDLPITPLASRSLDARAVLPERGVLQMPGLRYAGVSRRSAKLEFRAVVDHIIGRADDFDAVIINAGIIGSDLFTERLMSDARLTIVLLAVSASQSTFEVLDQTLSRIDRGPALAAVLTDASTPDG